jgi:D-glycero-D-manno-heptose 1,7-bisphosphate phosphatase
VNVERRAVARRIAVFLDRDDTLMRARGLPPPPPPAAPGDVCRPEDVHLLPGVVDACRRLKEAGFLLIVVSNQGVVARGGATVERVREINERLRDLVTAKPGRPLIDAVYVCPYHPKGTVPEFTREHPWRKPAPGMILAAAAEWKLDLGRSWMVGDSERDIEAAVAAGIPRAQCLWIGPHGTLADLPAAADVIVAETGEGVEE